MTDDRIKLPRAHWEKPKKKPPRRAVNRQGLKFLLAGAVILLAVLSLLVSGTLQGARYYITVGELLAEPSYRGQTLRVSGAVDGETIEYDSDNAIIRFEIVHIPSVYDDLATALHAALLDPSAARIAVIVEDAAMPDLLQHEAQAILTGARADDGRFYASELLLKCPSRFEEVRGPASVSDIPEQP